MSDEQWHGVAVQTCLQYARRQARVLWRAHGQWCDSSDYEGEALAALGQAVVSYMPIRDDARPDSFVPYFSQRVRYALMDYRRRGCGSYMDDASHPRGRGRWTAWRRYEWSWGHGDTESSEDGPASSRERWLLRHVGSDAWERQVLAGIAVRQALAALRPSELRAVVALRIEGLTTDEYGARWAVRPQTGVVVVSQALARLRARFASSRSVA